MKISGKRRALLFLSIYIERKCIYFLLSYMQAFFFLYIGKKVIFFVGRSAPGDFLIIF